MELPDTNPLPGKREARGVLEQVGMVVDEAIDLDIDVLRWHSTPTTTVGQSSRFGPHDRLALIRLKPAVSKSVRPV